MAKPLRPWLIGTGPDTTWPLRSSQAWFVESRPQAWTVGEHGYESRSGNCCFDGRELRGKVLLTVAAGSLAWGRVAV